MSKTNADVKPDEDATEETGKVTEEEKSTTDESTEQSNEDAGGDDEDEDKDERDDDLPDWARTKLTKANGEAARYRTRLRELEAKFQGAKTPEEFEAATKELAEANRATELTLAKERALRKHDLDEADLVLFDDVTDPEKVDAIAKRYAERIGSGSGSTTLRGGLDPTDDDTDTMNPGELAKKYGRRRY